MADPSLGEPSRASNALFKRQEQLQRWKQSETAREPVVKATKRAKLKFDDGTVFLSAVSASDIDEVKKLLQNGVDVNYQNIDGVTALHQACIDENYDLVELLVQRKSNLEIRDNEGWSALHAAASSGNLDITEFLVEHGADIAAVNNEGELPLDLAEEDEMEEFLQDQLQKSRVDVEAARAEEERVMAEDAQSWLNKGQITETKEPKTGATALHVAASKGYAKVINLLLQSGSDPNAPDVDEWTPLHAAAHWGQEEACKLLADYGADFALRNHVGLTPIDLAEPDMEKYLEELKKKQMEKPKINPITPSIKSIGTTVHPPLTRRRSITRIKDTGLISKTDVSQERKALAAVQKETLVEVKQETEEKSSSSSAESDTEEESDDEESEEESSDVESEEKENQPRGVSEKFANKRDSDSESEKNNRVPNSVKNQPVVNSVRGRNTAFSRFDNKNSVPTATATNSTARILNSTSRIYPNRQQSVEKKEEEPRPIDRFQSKGTAGNKVELARGRVNSNRSEDAAEAERTNSRDLDSRRKVFERNRPTSGYLAKANTEDSKDSKDSKDVKQDDGKDGVETKTNEDNTKNAKEEDARPSYRSQLRDTKQSSYQPRVRPSSRNFDEDKSKPNEDKSKPNDDKSKPNEDKSKPNDVDSYLARRGNLPGRAALFSDKDKDKSKENDATTISSYASRRSRVRDEADSTSSTTTTSASRPTSNYLRSTSSDNYSSRMSEREKEKERQKEKEKESEKEKQSEKEKEKEKEMEKESADKSAASSARARKMRRPREKRRSTGVAYMPSESDEEPDELQEAKKNTMMNEDIEEKQKPKEETKSVSDRIRQGRSGTSVTDRFKNSTKAADSKMPTDVNTLQEKLRETQYELDESKVKLEKTLEEKNKLERKLGDMEDDLKQLKDLKQDNQRLKDENGALIRVISKLSRPPT